ncbi:hypothetical protein RXV91_10705 [Lactiplantibacillus sp. DA1]|uniref:hypothetical protein n=1 Tax=Lactiplantibacillus sp. DA1 TaxID=3079857 RepID=UPI00292A671A|nr:hypothetical protein [Lactiplantibacillus sp. DA1]MDV0431340.1 hypothetical protein [Lactiplantibacillus sp. DA1]
MKHRKQSDSVVGKQLREEYSSINNAQKIQEEKELNKTTDFFLDLLIYFISMIWMFFAFMDTSSLTMRYFAIVNFGVQTMFKLAMHLSFYSAMHKYHPEMRIRWLAFCIQALFFVGLLGLVFVFKLVSNVPGDSTFSDILKSLSGIMTLLDGVLIFFVGVLDKICWTFISYTDKGDK